MHEQTGKKTVTAADLKVGMYFRYIHGEFRQLVKLTEEIYRVIDTETGRQGNQGSLEALASCFNGRSAIYEMLDEQPTLSLPVRVNPKSEPTQSVRGVAGSPLGGFDPYAGLTFKSVFDYYSKPAVLKAEPREIELRLSNGTVITVKQS